MIKAKKQQKRYFPSHYRGNRISIINKRSKESIQNGNYAEKNLEIVLQTARIEYQNIGFNTWTTQNNKLHTYLWLSVAILTAEIALLSRIFDKGIHMDEYSAPFVLPTLAVSILIGFIALVFGIDCMRGREKNKPMRPINGEYENYMIQVAEVDTTGMRTRKEAICAFANSIYRHLDDVDQLGRKMRKLAWLNIFSVIFGALSFITYCIQQYLRSF